MNLHYLQHVPFEGLASIETWVAARDHQVAVTRLHAGDLLPRLDQLDWLVVMGGPMNIYEEDKFPWLAAEKRFIKAAIDAGKIALGVCLGAQLIADVLGGPVFKNAHKEIGWFPVRKTEAAARSRVFEVLPAELEVFHWHGDTFALPPDATHVARSAACENQAFICDERIVGLQFHLETTPESARLLAQHCPDELVAGPFIQTAEAMLADERRFGRINETIWKLLDRLQEVNA
ncbi:MAG: type 1 glutamine amidotransferase [Verrucomicrobia bacterium]|nr:type 1 glutamine amidotransferase [Verrucomicrobiota bacterium]